MSLELVSRRAGDWLLVQSQPERPRQRVILLPGLLCTDVCYQTLLKSPVPMAAEVQIVVANPPGFKGLASPAGFDFTVESYASLLRDLLSREHADLVVGHSVSANFVMELGRREKREERLVLLSPTFRRASEPWDLRLFDAAARVPIVRTLVGKIAFRFIDTLFKPYFSEDSRRHLSDIVREARLSSIDSTSAVLNSFFNYFDQNRKLAEDLCSFASSFLIIRGTEDQVRFMPRDRESIGRAKAVRLREMPGVGHFPMVDGPHKLIELILEALQNAGSNA